MNTMSMPGFTAENSLYQASGNHSYRVTNRFGIDRTGTVMPQMRARGGRVVCTSRGCSCNSEERCNAMFSAPGLCGETASCNERGCRCSF